MQLLWSHVLSPETASVSNSIQAGAILPGSRSLFTANPLSHWSYDPFGQSKTLQRPRQSISLMKLSANGRYLALASEVIDLMDVERERLVRQFTDHTNTITGITCPQNSCHVWATVGADKTLRVLDSRKHPGQIFCKRFDCRYQTIGYAPNSEIIFCGGDNICVFDLRAMKEVAVIRTESTVLDLECHPEDCLILSCTDDRMVKVWDIDTHECVCQSYPLETQPQKVLFEPCGKSVIAFTARQIYSIEFDPFSVITQIAFSTAKVSNNFLVMDGQDIRNFESVACDVQTMDAVFENGTLMHFGFSPNRNSLDLRTVTVEELLTPTTAVPELPVPTSLPLNSSPDFGRLGSPLSNFNSPEADSIASSDVSPMFTLAPPFPSDSSETHFSLRKMPRSTSSSRSLKAPTAQMQKKIASSGNREGQNRARSSSTHSLHATVNRANSGESTKSKTGNENAQPKLPKNLNSRHSVGAPQKSATRPPSYPVKNDARPRRQSTVLEPDGFIESHQSTLDLLAKRKAEMTRIKSMMKNRNLEDDILDEASQLTDKSVLAHLLKTYPKPKTLKFAVRVLPEIRTMLSSTNSDFVEIGLTVLQDLASSLLPVIRQNIASDARSIGVDVVAEERQIMSIKCKEVLTEIYINSHFILERLNEEQQLKFNAAVEKFSDFV